MSVPDRRAKLDRADRTLSIRRQCALVGVARSSVYRPRRPANDNDVVPMRLIDELFTAWPFLGSRPKESWALGLNGGDHSAASPQPKKPLALSA